MLIIVGCLEAQVGVSGTMIMSAALCLPGIGQNHTEDVMIFVESILIVELTGHVVCITISRVTDVLSATLLIFTILSDA